MLAIAEETSACVNVTYCKWDARSVGDNPAWRERFDKVVSFHVLHWFPEHDQAFAGILACLKPGGEALVIMGHLSSIVSISVARFFNSHSKWAGYVKVDIIEKRLFSGRWLQNYVALVQCIFVIKPKVIYRNTANCLRAEIT